LKVVDLTLRCVILIGMVVCILIFSQDIVSILGRRDSGRSGFLLGRTFEGGSICISVFAANGLRIRVEIAWMLDGAGVFTFGGTTGRLTAVASTAAPDVLTVLGIVVRC